jgi:hypothetical protein
MLTDLDPHPGLLLQYRTNDLCRYYTGGWNSIQEIPVVHTGTLNENIIFDHYIPVYQYPVERKKTLQCKCYR